MFGNTVKNFNVRINHQLIRKYRLITKLDTLAEWAISILLQYEKILGYVLREM